MVLLQEGMVLGSYLPLAIIFLVIFVIVIYLIISYPKKEDKVSTHTISASEEMPEGKDFKGCSNLFMAIVIVLGVVTLFLLTCNFQLD